MRIPSGTTNRYVYFVAVDATDFTTRETGLSSFTVYRSRNGGAAAAMTTPTINETDSTNMPGVYELLMDEDTTLTAGNDTEEIAFHITHAGMAPVTRVIELYRPETTEGNTLDVTSTGAAGIDWANVENQSASVDLSATDINLCDTVTTNTDMRGTDSAFTAANALTYGLDHLISAALPTGWSTDVASGSVFASIAGATFDSSTDSLESIRDRGDAAWITGGGGSISDILNVQPLIPFSIDLANTSTYRIGLMLFNALDDLPSTAEITPGTISIDRKAIGGTSWSSVVTDAACSESAGLIYYDEVFDSGSGYAEGDSIRITLKSQKITVAANDYEITDATGRIFYTEVRQTMRGTDSAFLASSNGSSLTAIPWNAAWDAEVQSECTDALNAYDPPTNTEMAAEFTAIKGATWSAVTDTLEAIRDRGDSAWITATGFSTHSAADVRTEIDSNSTQLATIVADTNELQTDWANGGRLDLLVDAILEDTGTTLPAAIPSAATIATTVLTTQMTESYAAAGAAPTLAQAMFWVYQDVQEAAVVGTTKTVKKLDQATAAGTVTLDDANTPTSLTRAT